MELTKMEQEFFNACEKGYIGTVKLLLEHGVDVNIKDKYVWTPLHIASYYGYKEIVNLLIQNGADVNVKDNNGRTPLRLASFYGHTETVNLLESYMKDSKYTD